ncbi:MAG: terminase large subunit [Rhodospirillales bacterium]|nr:terminase large subunit [Rhodospirillales bacterium]
MKGRAVQQYIEGLTIGQGRHAGSPFKVLPFQKRFLNGAFAAGIGEAAWSLARGGGKSTTTAAIGCAALDGPLAQPDAEVLIVASSHEQGQIVFRHCLRFLAPKIDRNEFRVADTVNTSRLVHRRTGAMLIVKGSDPKRLHGAAPALTICDEVAQWPNPRIEEMLSALRTAAGKIPDSRMLMIGTRPADEGHPFAVALRDSDYVQVHAAGKDDPPFRSSIWKKANPGLDHFPDLLTAIRREAKSARKDESLLAQFRALRLNQGVADTVVNMLLEADLWKSIEGEAERSGPCIFGVDLGTTQAQSAIAGFWPETGRLEAVAAFPHEPSLEDRGHADGVGNLYRLCADRGELVRSGGRAVNVAELVEVAVDRFGRPASVSADRWRAGELADALQAAGINPAFDARGQGFKDGGEDVRSFRRACADGRVTPVPSLLLRSAMAGARTVSDPAGNSKLAKGSEGGRRLRARDDAVAASVLAVSSGVRQADRPAGGGYLGLA